MNKAHIISEIQRTAKENGGVPLGVKRFQMETGIIPNDWEGRFWVRWSDAVSEAGYTPNTLQGAYEDDFLLQHFVTLVRELGHYPVKNEIILKHRQNSSFPSHAPFRRLGNKKEIAAKVVAFCEAQGGFDDVIEICTPVARQIEENLSVAPVHEVEEIGYIYLLKAGKYYKIGRTNAPGRRERELVIQLPEKAKLVHQISTDDPIGIEAYWHRRFESRHKNGEWFELTSDDVRAFKRRTFM